MVTTFYPPHAFGGDGIAVQRWARALARARHVGPAAEIVATTGAGVLFDGPKDLAPLLHRMASDADFRDALAARALPSVAAHYAEDVVVPRMVALRESAVARNRGS